MIRWTPERLEQVRELHRAGLTNKQMAQRLGVTYDVITQCLSIRLKLKANWEPGVRRWSETDRNTMRELHAQGLTNREIAEHFGVKRNSIASYITTILGLQSNRAKRAPKVPKRGRCRIKRAPVVKVLNPYRGRFDSHGCMERLAELLAA